MIEPINETPVVRIWTFGDFCVERRDRDGTWSPVQLAEWGGNTNSRRVLKYLLCHGRAARRGMLMESLWPGSESAFLEEYLNKAASNIRHVCRLEQSLVTRNNRTTYVLADQPVIWTDKDACEVFLREAEQVECTLDAKCQLLEAAQTYFERGSFLEGEDGLWCHGYRGKLETAAYRCVLSLSETYEMQGDLGKAEQQIEKLLQKNVTDETAFRRLLLLFQKQGLLSQALQRYKATKRAMERQGLHFSQALEHFTQHLENRMNPPSFLISTLSADFSLSGGSLHAILTEETASVSNTEEYAMDQFRREMLKQAIQLTGASLLIPGSLLINELLSFYATGIAACWDLYFSGNIRHVTTLLPLYRSQLIPLAHAHSSIQKSAAALVSQAYQLTGELASDREHFDAAQEAECQAYLYAQLAEDRHLQVSASIQLANLSFHRHQPEEALRIYKRVLPLIDSVTPLLKGRVYAGMAEVHGMSGQRQEAFSCIGLAHEHYPQKPENDPAYPYTHASRYSLYVFGEVQTRLFLHQPTEASKVLTYVGKHIVDAQIEPLTQIDLLYYQAMAATMLRDMDAGCNTLREAATLAKKVGSRLYFRKLQQVYQEMCSIWSHETRVQAVAPLLQKWE